MNQITNERLEKYVRITGEALAKAKAAPQLKKAEAADVLDMAQRYYDDALHFKQKGEIVNAFACLNYAHGWLDAGARLGLFKVNDSRLFTVDDE
ncbi:MAG: DUF357 domain-containing protein [Candidatus Woesearchaeota archaeon]|nr:DUF357 domain-containing protein [Candidatus Woesearchaeota archaeon]